MSTITIPEGYDLVLASLLSSAWLLAAQSRLVGKHRKRAGIKYPQMYAEKAEAAASDEAWKFNCAQRAHQNTLEYIPMVWISTIISGLKYPTIAAAASFIWVIGRIFFTRGYLTGDPQKRVSPLYVVATVLGGLGTFVAANLIVGQWLYERIARCSGWVSGEQLM